MAFISWLFVHRHECIFPSQRRDIDGLTMRVAFVLDLAQLGIRVLVMHDTHLVVTLNLATSHLDPFANTDEVLRLDTLISKEFLTRHQIHKVCSGRLIPRSCPSQYDSQIGRRFREIEEDRG